jgi:uncharacterized coiled-coil protein SlyX
MIEAGVTLAIAAAAGLATITTRLHGRIHEVDRRLDQVELRVAERYVSKADLSEMMTRMEDHMVRIEEKLDRITVRTHV